MQNWFGKAFLHPFLKLPLDQFVPPAAAACLEECCKAVLLLRGQKAAPHFPLAAENIESESFSRFICSLKKVTMCDFFYTLLCIYYLHVCLRLHNNNNTGLRNSEHVLLHLDFLLTVYKTQYSPPHEPWPFCWRVLHYPEGKSSDEL